MKAKQKSVEPVLLFESVDLTRTVREWKSPLLSVEFLFIQTYKELSSAYKKLQDKEKEFEFYNVEMKNKWEKLKNKQAEFLRSVQNYDTFFVENEMKSDRILQRIKFRTKEKEKPNAHIDDSENRIKFLTTTESKFENSVEELAPYHNFLGKSVQIMNNIDSVANLINYYGLMNREIQLLKQLHCAMLNSEKLHIIITEDLKSKITRFHEQSNAIFYSNKECNDKMNLKNEIDLEFLRRVKLNKEITTDVQILKQCCNNIFLGLLKWKKTKFSPNMNEEKKLSFIIISMSELREALDLALQLNNKKDTSSQADSSFITARRIN